MKIKHLSLLLILSFVITLLTTCTVEKRHYRKGYHISRNSNANTISKINRDTKLKHEVSLTKEITAIENSARIPQQNHSFFNISDEENSEFEKKSQLKVASGDTCNDVLIFRNGEEFSVKIIDKTDDVIKYKRCDNMNGPVYSVKTNDIFMIKYANGSKEVFKKPIKENEQVRRENTVNNSISKEYNSFAIVSFICALLFFLSFTLILAFIFGIIALKQINRNPDRYRGKGMAVFGVVMGSIAIFLFLLVLLIIFLLL